MTGRIIAFPSHRARRSERQAKPANLWPKPFSLSAGHVLLQAPEPKQPNPRRWP